MKWLILLFFSFILVFFSFAQEYSYKHYTVQDGLLQMQVTALFQDSKGYLWAGTRVGVSRFDGISFINFTQKDGLLEGHVLDIMEDHHGNMIFMGRNGFSVYDGDTIKAFSSTLFQNKIAISKPFYRSDSLIFYLHRKKNYIQEVIFIHDQFVEGKHFTYELPNNQEDIKISYSYDVKSQTYWFGGKYSQLNQITKGKLYQNITGLQQIGGLHYGKDEQLYAISENKLFRIKGNKPQPLHTIYSIDTVSWTLNFVADSRGSIYYFNQKTQQLQIYDRGKEFIEQFEFGGFLCMLVDEEENVWIGTETGLYKLSSRAFLNFLPKKNGMKSDIWSVGEGKNKRIYFASYLDGPQHLENGQFVSDNSYRRVTGENEISFYMGSTRDTSGNVYFTTTNYLALKYDGKNYHKMLPDNKIRNGFIALIDPDNQDLLFGANDYFYRFSNGKPPKAWEVRPGNGKSTIVTGLAKDKLNRYWLGGFNGISLLQDDSVIHFPNDSFPFSYGGNALIRDKKDKIWIGNAHGLFFFDYQSFTHIEHPKLQDMVVAFDTVGDSLLLVATIKGLLMIDLHLFYEKDSLLLTSIGSDKGFHAIEPGQNGFFRDTDGYHWLTASDRVVRLDPHLLIRNPSAPKVYIQNLSLLDEKMRWQPVSLDKQTIPEFYYAKGEKNLRFDFVGISFKQPEAVTYMHRLDGYDNGWSESGSDMYAIYTNLPPGNYTLLVKAANADHVWSVEPAKLSFRIVPALHQKLWFRVFGIVMGVFVIGAAGAFINHLRRRRQQEIDTHDRQLSELRLLTIKNQIDPHFTYNAINTIASSVLKEDKQLAYSYFVKLSQLMRSVLQTNDRLERSLEEELLFAKNYLDIQLLRFKDRFEYSVEVQAEVDYQLMVPKMCIQTFTENAVKHGLMQSPIKGQIRIQPRLENELLLISISDNGIGRAKANSLGTKGTGMGLEIFRRYVDHFNKYNAKRISWKLTDLFQPDGNTAGTQAEISIPITYSDNYNSYQP
ncbi:MAG: histidine kinase [Bacteroidales bacterium]